MIDHTIISMRNFNLISEGAPLVQPSCIGQPTLQVDEQTNQQILTACFTAFASFKAASYVCSLECQGGQKLQEIKTIQDLTYTC